MDEQMFAELEASLLEGVEILRGEKQPSRTFAYTSLQENAAQDHSEPPTPADPIE